MDSILIAIIAILIVVIIYKLGTKDFDYFTKKGIPFAKPIFLVGTSGGSIIRKYSLPEYVTMRYNSFPENKVFGLFEMGKPLFFIRDPEMIKQMTIKDFDHFTNHRSVLDEKVDALFSNSLFTMKGQKWRDMRATLSPAFTGSKMRQMFELISRCGDNMSKYFISESQKGNSVYEMKDIFSRFANDVIATTAFGYEIDSLKDKDNAFFKMGNKLMQFNRPIAMLKFFFFMTFPWVMKVLKIALIDKKASGYFKEMIRDTMQHREEKGIVRHDMINLLMQVKKGKLSHTSEEKEKVTTSDGFATVEESNVGKSVVKREWSEDEIAGQCFIFFLAGFDTISTLLSFLVYEVAVNPDIQQRLYEEISEVNESLEGKLLTYEAMQNMKYLDMVVSEALRKWPPAPAMDRECVKEYQYSDDNEVKFTMEKGTVFWIPIYAFHRDPKFYPNPDVFDPERFNEEKKHLINPLTYLPFGTGPRNCIGSRFALMEAKAVVYYLLLNLSVEPNEKTQIPLKFARTGFNVAAEKGVWLTFKPRN